MLAAAVKDAPASQSNFMVPRRLRLSRHTFPLSRSGTRLSTSHFSLVWGRAQKGGGCAAVISKKVARRSVDRHLLKRRIMAVLLPWCGPDRFFVVYALSGSNTLSFQALKEELGFLLMKTKLGMAQ